MNRTSVLRRLTSGGILVILGLVVIEVAPGCRSVIGLIVAIPSFILLIAARVQLGKSFSVTPKAKGLVTSGIYSRIQHPMYLFLDLALLGIIIAFAHPLFLVPWGLLVVVQSVRARREEDLLLATFGNEYTRYVASTWF